LTLSFNKLLQVQNVADKISENIKYINDLILKRNFIPFPPRPRNALVNKTSSGSVIIQFPPIDGYENNRELNLISRAIIFRPEFVSLWKKIGYNEVCSDLNELVVEGELLICFPPNPSSNWTCPTADYVIEKLQKLFDLGFQLTDKVIEELLFIFGSRIYKIGEPLLEAISIIKGKSTPSIVELKLKEVKKLRRRLRCKRKLD
jgi:hypothetical protein